MDHEAKEKHTIVIKIEGCKIVDLIQLSYREVMRMPTNPAYKTFPTKELIVFLYDTELHLSLKPGGLKEKGLAVKNFLPLDKNEEEEKAFKEWGKQLLKKIAMAYRINAKK